ncbi:hypothetical protein GJAV_G00003650 [Gymnothorax javanicus]|nr:hypothetical protein GJAV_G00003650 [Gymnothorax javanicus]
MHYLSLLHLFLSITRTLAAEFHQERFIRARNGSSTRLPCRQEGTLEYMYWYRQVPGRGLILLYLSRYEGFKADNEINDPRFSAERPNRQNFPLNITDLQRSDSAVYYCASSSHDDTKPYCAQSKTCAALFLFPTRDLVDGVSTEEIQASACSESNRQKPKWDNPAAWLKGSSDSQIQGVGSESC